MTDNEISEKVDQIQKHRDDNLSKRKSLIVEKNKLTDQIEALILEDARMAQKQIDLLNQLSQNRGR